MDKNSQQSLLLIVDDTPSNLDLLLAFLSRMNFRIVLAEDGEEALDKLQIIQPDLILLDIMMPGIDGFETCLRIKANPVTQEIPVIFMTALDESEFKLRGFQVGAVDYITKPFQQQEVLARINTQLTLLHQTRLLQASERELTRRVEEKTYLLAEANKKLNLLDKAKNDFLSLISHELRTPLTGLLASADLFFDHHLSAESHEKIKQAFKESLDRLHEIVKQALLLTEIQNAGDLFLAQKTPLDSLLETAVVHCQEFANFRHVTIQSPPQTHVWIKADSQLFIQALDALIRTAIKFSHPQKIIEIGCQTENHHCVLSISATGLSVPEEHIPEFFNVLSIVNPITPGGDLGLEPPVADQILSLFNAQVEVQNKINGGIIFDIYLSTYPDNEVRLAVN